MSGLFAAVTLFILFLFIRALTEKEIRTGLFTFAIFTAATTIGMWRIRRWGRSLALVVAVGNVGLGALALVAVLTSNEGGWIGPAILLVASLGLGYMLGRPIFNLDDDYR